MFCCHETDDRFQSLQLLIATFAVIINTLMMLFMGQNCQLLAVHKIFKNSIQTSSKIISFISVIGIKNSFYVRRDFFCAQAKLPVVGTGLVYVLCLKRI